MGAEVLVPEVRLVVPSTSTAGDGRITLGPRAVRELGVQLGDPVAVDVRWSSNESGGERGGDGGGGPVAAGEWTWTFLVRFWCFSSRWRWLPSTYSIRDIALAWLDTLPRGYRSRAPVTFTQSSSFSWCSQKSSIPSFKSRRRRAAPETICARVFFFLCDRAC